MRTGRRSERRLGQRWLGPERAVPAAVPTRPTLVFPAVDVPRVRRPSMPPPLPHADAREHVPARAPKAAVSASDVSTEAGAPAARPSERPTLKTLPPVDAPSSGNSNTQVIELSASALDSDPGLDAKPSVIDREAPWGEAPRATRSRRRSALVSVALVAVGAMIAGGTAAVVAEQVTGARDGRSGPAPAPRRAASEHTPLVLRAGDGDAEVAAGTCVAAGSSRVLATRAHLPPGLDVNALEGGGFGVGFAASAEEALGVRVEGAPLRVAERMRVRAGGPVRHVAVESGRADAAEAIELRIDGDGGRTRVAEGDAPALRVVVAGGWVQAVVAGRARTLWPVPGGTGQGSGAVQGGGAGQGDGAGQGGGAGARGRGPVASFVAAPALRVGARGDGGALVALARSSTLWLGAVDGTLAVEGPLVALPRGAAALGVPSVAPRGGGAGGGVVTWAERPTGDLEWVVMVASFGATDGAAPERPVPRRIGAGMSPSIALLPDGDLLLAHAVGTAGAHRVLARRLGRDLEPRGEPILVSPEALNAGQPAAAAASDGRALVGFFAAERGRPTSVLATPLVCAPRP